MTTTRKHDRFCTEMSFDTLAPFYRRMEQLFADDRMQRCRIAFLDQIPEAKDILLPGEGAGSFLVPCRGRFPRANIVCVDSSAAMIGQARRSLARAGLREDGVSFVQADLLAWEPPSAQFDLIGTHFFLDCFREDQLDPLISRLAAGAKPAADWIIADFQLAPAGWPRIRSRFILAMLYAFFRAATRLPATSLTPPGPFIERRGFRLVRRIEHDRGLLRSDWWRRK